MNDETRRTATEMEQMARKAYERVRPHLTSGEMSASDLKMIMSIFKDAAEIMRDAAEIKKYSEKYSDKHV